MPDLPLAMLVKQQPDTDQQYRATHHLEQEQAGVAAVGGWNHRGDDREQGDRETGEPGEPAAEGAAWR